MVKGDKVRLNHELLIWRGFTLSNGVWSDPDGVTVDNGVPYFPEDETACFKWLEPRIDHIELNTGMLYNRGKCLARAWNSGGVYKEVVSTTPALALCLAIQKLIRSK